MIGWILVKWFDWLVKAGLDKSSDCVDSVLDNLPSVAEDEEFDLNEDVSDAMKCLDDVIEADETEESDEPVRGAVDTDDDSASNEIPSVECEYGAGRDAEIDGTFRSHKIMDRSAFATCNYALFNALIVPIIWKSWK